MAKHLSVLSKAYGRLLLRGGVLGGLGLMIASLGLLVLPFGLYEHVSNQQFLKHSLETSATVISQSDSGSRAGGTIVEFEYTVNNHLYRSRDTAVNVPVSGTQLVRYDPAHPQKARLANANISDREASYTISRAFIVSGLAAYLVGCIIQRLRSH